MTANPWLYRSVRCRLSPIEATRSSVPENTLEAYRRAIELGST